MDFRTELKIQPSGLDLDYSDKISMIGSCFADNIGRILEDHRLPVKFNSHGILFNPASIYKALHDTLTCKKYTIEELRKFEGKYVSMNHHGRFSDPDPSTVLKKINDSIETALEHLKTSKVLFITFGSAFAWKQKSTDTVVANCHKIPQIEFEKTLLEHAEIVSSFTPLFHQLRNINPDLQIVLTVSPVRYFRDGVVANNLSKSNLLIACHTLSKENRVHYFPAFEWVIDDLRDYRFFKEDMVHPNDQAIRYIWEKFLDWAMNKEVINKIKQVGQLNRGLHHLPQPGNSADEHARKQAILAEIEEIIRS
ncbi:MAG: GSCFA domain-containing protein [Flavobacteriales bacterium]